MKKLFELFQLPPTKGDVGIEIECEGEDLACVDSGGWCTVPDHSLRGDFPNESCEWVMNRPVNLQDVLPSLQYLRDKQQHATLNFSFRTSVHVHVNVQRLTTNEILNMCYTYVLLETVLMDYCAEWRRGNRFCLRAEDAEDLIYRLQKLGSIDDDGWQKENPRNAARYAALNIEALWKYGSLEFRGMEGTLDITRIDTWVHALVAIRSFSTRMKNVQSIHDLFVRESPATFMSMVLGDVAHIFMKGNWIEGLRKGFSISIDIPYAYKEHKQDQQLVAKVPAYRDRVHRILLENPINPFDPVDHLNMI